jgi:hypothetical protein
MADTLDMSMDFLVWTNTTQVSYESARARASIVDVPAVYDGVTPAPVPPASTNVVYPIATAKRRSLRRTELVPSGGVVLGDEQVWIIPDVMFPAGVVSKPGDVIVETTTGTSNEEQPGTRWTVLAVDPWGKNRWTRRFMTKALGLSGMEDTINVERPKITYDAAGCAIKQFPSDATNPAGVVTYASLPCRVQLVTKPEEDEMGIRGSAGDYEVTLGADINITREDRIKLASGQYLDVVNYRQAERIDQLPVIECRRKV